MNDTGFFVPDDKKDRFAMSYEWASEGEPLYANDSSHLCVHYDSDIKFESGGAGLTSTIDDYAKFAMMLADNGCFNGKRFLGDASVEFKRTNHLTPDQMGWLDWKLCMHRPS